MNLNPLQTPQSVPRKFFEAQAQFGIYLLKALMPPAQSNSSLVLSPISLSSVLSQLHLGAGGQTAVELSKIFGDGIFGLNFFCKLKNYSDLALTPQQIGQYFGSLSTTWKNSSTGMVLETANKIYLKQGFAVSTNYRQLSEYFFGGESFQSLDFGYAAAAAKVYFLLEFTNKYN